jgi:enamine deaminase RidA (YjgF/YER057c/UK114 family)
MATKKVVKKATVSKKSSAKKSTTKKPVSKKTLAKKKEELKAELKDKLRSAYREHQAIMATIGATYMQMKNLEVVLDGHARKAKELNENISKDIYALLEMEGRDPNKNFTFNPETGEFSD